MTLRVTEDNPLPEGIISGYLTAKKGLKLRYALLSREEPGPGTVVLLQGRCEAIEKYFETIGDLRAMGFDCATLDWRGQGGSDRMLRDRMAAHVRSFDHYVEDLTLFFNEVVLQSCRPPYFILAHSMGGLVTLLALPQLAQHVRRGVLLAPLLGLNEAIDQKWIGKIASLLCGLGLGSRYFPQTRHRGRLTAFEGNRVTSDRRRFERNRAIELTFPELTVGRPTAAWVQAACDAIKRVHETGFMAANRTPLLLVAAGSDAMISNDAIEDYARRIRSGHCLVVDGARHELLQESDIYREQALAAFRAFVTGRMTSEEPGEAETIEPERTETAKPDENGERSEPGVT